MNKPAAFSQRISISDESGQSLCDIAVAPVSGYIGQTCSKEQFDVDVDQRPFDVVEFEHFRDGSEGRQTESGADSRFGSSGDEELDVRYLLDIAGEYRQDGGGRFFILALVEGIDDDQG
jgi:hypothetical protein